MQQPAADPVAGFAAALADPTTPLPAGLRRPDGAAATRRYAVYRNNVAMGLREALGANFPAIRRLLGDAAFALLARDYLAARWPRTRLAFEVGRDLADFLDDFAPLADLAYLTDVARVEAAMIAAYHAADDPVLDGADLAGVAPEALPGLRLVPHRAFALVRSAYAVVTIVEANRADGPVGAVDAGMAQDALVTRPGFEPQLRALPPGCAMFLASLGAGRPLGEAAEEALAASADFDFAGAIGVTLASGAFARIAI